MSLETRLRDDLHTAAGGLAWDPGDLNATMRRGRRRRLAIPAGFAVAATATVAALVAVIVLSAPGVAPPAPEVSGSPPARGAQVVVFLCDGLHCPRITDDQRAELRDALEADERIARLRYEASEDAYRRFEERFSEQRELVDSVDPEDLPGSFRLELAPNVPPAAVVITYATFAGVADAVVQQR